jgi:hypothetical protein
MIVSRMRLGANRSPAQAAVVAAGLARSSQRARVTSKGGSAHQEHEGPAPSAPPRNAFVDSQTRVCAISIAHSVVISSCKDGRTCATSARSLACERRGAWNPLPRRVLRNHETSNTRLRVQAPAQERARKRQFARAFSPAGPVANNVDPSPEYQSSGDQGYRVLCMFHEAE